jgi:hypothetical protein
MLVFDFFPPHLIDGIARLRHHACGLSDEVVTSSGLSPGLGALLHRVFPFVHDVYLK